MAYAGHLDCYQKCNEIIDKFLSVKVDVTQVYRVTNFYGAELRKTDDVTQRTLSPLKNKEVLYAELDGSMLQTRYDGWKEVKLGRVFKSGDCIDTNGESSWIRHSQYLAHLGDCKIFTGQLEDLLGSYGNLGERLVFINDGATWIRQWIEDAFPNAISILDLYHALEHLHLFVNSFFVDKEKAKKWIKKQNDLLLKSEVKQVIKNIKKLSPQNEAAKKLIVYYQVNAYRMDYKKYKNIGAGIIGSGAIESAHRTVIQKRMKLSGQRWSEDGAQNMLRLRTGNMNGQWDKVIQLTKNNFKKTA